MTRGEETERFAAERAALLPLPVTRYEMILWQRDHDLGDAIARGQRGNAHLEDRSAADLKELLRAIRAEANPPASGGDDGGNVHGPSNCT